MSKLAHTEQELIEQLADKKHDNWARWMIYLFSKCEITPSGSAHIPPALVNRWRRQASLPYTALTEEEKQLDRDEVERIMPIIREYVKERINDFLT